MNDAPRYDLTRLPEVIEAVLDFMPTGDMWAERFADAPGLALRRDDDGWVTVLHRGDRVFQLDPDVLRPDADTGRARVWVDGQPREVGLALVPRDELE